MANLGKPTWGSGPSIACQFDYEYYRSGANMYYRVIGYVNTEKKSVHFGYYITAHIYLDGVWKYSKTLKSNDPAYWSDQLSFDSGYQTVAGKVSGSTQIRIRFETNAPRGESNWYYTGAVSPAGSDISAGNGKLGVEQTITLTRRNSAFTDTVTWECGSQSGTIAEKSSATSFKFTPPISLAAQNTTGVSVPIKFTTSTYSGNTLIQSKSVTITCEIPDSVVPSCTVQISDPTGNLEKYGAYVQSKSQLQIIVTPTLAYGSEINLYTVTADGNTYNNKTVATPALINTGEQTVQARVTDKRGRVSETVSETYNVLAYTPPSTANVVITRCDQDGTVNPEGHYMLVQFSGSVTPLANKNAAVYKIRRRVAGDNTWQEDVITELNGSYSGTAQRVYAAADDKIFDVEIDATDDFSTSVITGMIPIAFTIMNWRTEGDGMAIGGINTKPGLQVYMDAEFTGDVHHESNPFVLSTDEEMDVSNALQRYLLDEDGTPFYPYVSGQSVDYATIGNKPQINGVPLVGDKSSGDLKIATKTSDLENNSYFVSDALYEHLDRITNAEIEALTAS